MQLDPAWLAQQGDDIRLLKLVEVALAKQSPKKVGVAVSGGGDSMGLLHLALRWSAQTGIPVQAVTIDHGLRVEAADEAAMVASFCENAKVPHETIVWQDWDGHGNVQAAARDARYRLIGKWAAQNGIDLVTLGHTKDDGAETFLMRLARKAGIDGLATSDTDFTRNGVLWSRPLWLATRQELREYLMRHDVNWIDDPSNDDIDFERVRLRKAMAVLQDNGVGLDALHHAAFANREARDALEHYTMTEAKRLVREEDGDLIMPLEPDVPTEIARRLRVKAVQWVGQMPYPPRHAAMQQLISGLWLEGTQTLGGCIVTQKDGQLRFTREHRAVAMTCTTTQQIWDGRWQIDGPHATDLQIRALGEGIHNCPDWRKSGLPRVTLLASPAIWRDETLIAAPLAGYNQDWSARIVADFHSSLLAH